MTCVKFESDVEIFVVYIPSEKVTELSIKKHTNSLSTYRVFPPSIVITSEVGK